MIDFIAHNWHWFGFTTFGILILCVINFIVAARYSMRMDRQVFVYSIGVHLFLGLLFLLSAIPFSIGAIIAIIKYVQAQ
jgi:bacteriorhodopsin